MSYLWGDVGVVPSESCFNIHGLISLHYAKSGGYYPVGGASEFALSMIPIVERAGGKGGCSVYDVLTRFIVHVLKHNLCYQRAAIWAQSEEKEEVGCEELL